MKMLNEEKKRYYALEVKLRHVVSKQWEHLRSSVMSIHTIHPVFWGHKTRTLRRSRNHAGPAPPLLSQQRPPPKPVPLPPRVKKHEVYTNKSTILACPEDGDWQVPLSDEDASDESSTTEVEVSREIIAEVYAPDTDAICQGTTNSPAKCLEVKASSMVMTSPPCFLVMLWAGRWSPMLLTVMWSKTRTSVLRSGRP